MSALVAESTTLWWNAKDLASFWSQVSTETMWNVSQYRQMTYEDRILVNSALAGSNMTIAATIEGDPWSVQYRENSAAKMWDADATALMWTADATEWWDAPPWLPWPGSIVAKNSVYDFLITTGQGITQGVISAFTINVDAPDLTELLDDVAIAAGGTRLALTKTFAAIKGVNLTLANDGGSALTAKVEDKDATLGPLIKCYDAANAATTGRVDALVQGY